MMQKFLAIATTISALGLATMPAKAAETLLGTTLFPIEFTTATADLNQANFSAIDGFGSGTPVTLFISQFYTATTPGQPAQSLTFLPGTGDANTDAFAALLTDGINEVMELRIGLHNTSDADRGGTFTDVNEKERFSLSSNDFAGYSISKIVFNLNSLSFAPTATGGTRANFDANLQVFTLTPVPEPGMLLSGMAMVTMTGLCRPRWRKAM